MPFFGSDFFNNTGWHGSQYGGNEVPTWMTPKHSFLNPKALEKKKKKKVLVVNSKRDYTIGLYYFSKNRNILITNQNIYLTNPIKLIQKIKNPQINTVQFNRVYGIDVTKLYQNKNKNIYKKYPKI